MSFGISALTQFCEDVENMRLVRDGKECGRYLARFFSPMFSNFYQFDVTQTKLVLCLQTSPIGLVMVIGSEIFVGYYVGCIGFPICVLTVECRVVILYQKM